MASLSKPWFLLFYVVGTIISSAAQAFSTVQIVFKDGYPMVDCSFNGVFFEKGCLLDTGAPEVTLPPGLWAASEGYPKLKDPDASHDPEGAKGVEMKDCDVRAVLQLKVGDFISPVHQAQRCQSVGTNAGNLGINVLDGKVWNFDFEKNVLIQEHQLPMNLKIEPLWRSSQGHIFLAASVGSSNIRAAFDTGSPETFIDLQFVKNHPDDFVCSQKDVMESTGWTFYQCSTNQLVMNHQVFDLSSIYAVDFSKIPVFKDVLLKNGAVILLGDDAREFHQWHMNLQKNLWALGR